MNPTKPTRKRIDAILDDVRAERHDQENALDLPPRAHVHAAHVLLIDSKRCLAEWPSTPDAAEARSLLIEAAANLVQAIEAIDLEASRG